MFSVLVFAGANNYFNVTVLGNAAGANLATEKTGYASGETVNIYGSGFGSFEDVSIAVEAQDDALAGNVILMQWNVFSDKGGNFIASIPFDSLTSASGRYVVTATGTESKATAETTIAGALAAAGNLDQCANGGIGDPVVPCANPNWENGNVNQSKAHWREGDSVAYRQILTGFTPGSTGNTVTLGYDTTKGGKHALDYLTSFDRTETQAMGNNPCSGVAGCSLGTFTTFPIPVDPKVTAGHDQIPANGDDITQIPGVFTLFGGTITNISAYTYSGSYAGDSHTSLVITFTADQANMVLSWGGHIGTRADWGADNSAVFISGSPYHMSQDACSFGCGSQDRALSASAILLTSKVVIIKQAAPESPFAFGFTTTGTGLSNFSLVDDGVDNDATPNNIEFSVPLSTGQSSAFSVTESQNGAYDLVGISCSVTGTGGSVTATNVPASLLTGTLQYGDTVTCTFNNAVTTAANLSIAGRTLDAYGNPIARTRVTVQNTSTGEFKTVYSNSFGAYTVNDLPAGDLYVVNVSNKRYTFPNDTQSFVLNDAVENLDFTAAP